MGYGWGEALADVATGGAYSIGKEIYKAASGSDKDAGAIPDESRQSSGSISETSSIAPKDFPMSKELKYCNYTLNGDYLLNGETGQVWLIDKANKELIPIKHQKLSLESAANAIRLEYFKQYLLGQKDAEIGKLHHSIRDNFTKSIGKIIDIIDKEIANMI